MRKSRQRLQELCWRHIYLKRRPTCESSIYRIINLYTIYIIYRQEKLKQCWADVGPPSPYLSAGTDRVHSLFIHWTPDVEPMLGQQCRRWTSFNPTLCRRLVLFNLNFHPLESVSRWRDPQLQISENYSDLKKWRSTVFKYCWLMSYFILTCLKSGT